VKGRPKSRQGEQAEEAAVIAIRVQPRASRNRITLEEDGSYKIRLTAPPVDGAANEALVGYLSGVLNVSKSSVEIVSGLTGRQKRVRISGMGTDAVKGLLNTKAQ
jgi:uncharacterized protein (TIGR00251 family)